MAGKASENSWIESVIAMDRSQRSFYDFCRPILRRHSSDLNQGNLLFLLSIGPGDVYLNDIVNKGRYVGSNASYAFKLLQAQGYIDRRQDLNDRRNAIVTYTKKGSDLVRDIRHVSRSHTKANREVCDLLGVLDNHCARLPSEA